MKDYGTVRIMKKVKDFEIRKSEDSDEILEQMGELGGFQGNKVGIFWLFPLVWWLRG